MDWYPRIYTGRAADKKKKKIMAQIERQHYVGRTFLVTLAANPENQLDILPVCELHFPYIRRNCPMIVGIALGREEALELVQAIVQEVYESTGGVDLRGYFESGAAKGGCICI